MKCSLKQLYNRLVVDGWRIPEDGSRNGATRALYGESLSIRVDQEFPLTTLRQLSFKTVREETLWYLRGDDHVRTLRARGVHIWDKWADPEGNLGPIYGAQWRRWSGCRPAEYQEDGRSTASSSSQSGEYPTFFGPYVYREVDQLAHLEAELRKRPMSRSRRMLVSAWNVADLPRMALPPCPFAFQVHAHPFGSEEALSMTVYQRSADAVVGVPHDLAVHALLLSMLAAVHGRRPHKLTLHFGDLHLYEDHLSAVHTMLGRDERQGPVLRLLTPSSFRSVTEYGPEHVSLTGYRPHEKLSVRVHE